MEYIEIENGRIYYDASLLSEDPREVFDAEYWQAKKAVVGSAQGRGTTWFVQGAQLRMALRHYWRGGLFARLVKDSYCFTSWATSRSVAEFSLLKQLRAAGLNVPRPVAARVQRHGLFYRADLLSEYIQGTEDLVALLQRKPLEKNVYADIGRMIRRMHDLGVCHSDLNSHNILLGADGQCWLIDFDKCRLRSGDAWKRSNLERLQRSFKKEISKRNIHFSDDDWLALNAAYEQA